VIGPEVPEESRLLIIMLVLGLLSWPPICRLTRGQILVEREKDFVAAAKALGVKQRIMISRHILPNILSVILVNVTVGLATIMLFEATLAFLGFGVMEPRPSWGNMLTNLSSLNIRFHWWRWVFPAATLSFAVISISMIGDALRDALDPKLNSR
jgi:peptide/nickel transport system permease protein